MARTPFVKKSSDEATAAAAAASVGPFITDFDLHLLAKGDHFDAYNKLGAHPTVKDGKAGTYFAVWAPNAHYMAVVGDWNGWNPATHPMQRLKDSGFWDCFIPDIGNGAIYKYFVDSKNCGIKQQKADPYGFYHELRPRTASIVWDISKYQWADKEWMANRKERHSLNAPISIYEVHLGSWMRAPEANTDGHLLNYRDLGARLSDYCHKMGFTHVELMPITEHPFDGSWGYQTTGYFAPTSRFGTPDDFRAFVDAMHQRGIGVLLDWVPAHFPKDEHGLALFDGTRLYEHSDWKEGEHKDWGTLIFNFGRWEVRNFLVNSGLFWLDKYHLDGLRVDAVASMLYRNYSRKEGEWIPNQYGGKENIEAIEFLRHMNYWVYNKYPDIMTMAEESTSWPMVSRPVYIGGLGFGLKWDMGWMHDTLRYFSKDPVYRKFHHNDLTFRMLYAWHENFILPLSHDEVVHGKGSLIGKMPGDYWQKFANLRALFGYMFAQPAKKLIFMGGEFGHFREWSEAISLDWHVLEYPMHRGLQNWVADLNRVYRAEKALHEQDCEPGGFEWVDCNDSDNGVIALLRYNRDRSQKILFVANFTPIPRFGYRVGVPEGGQWQELLNSDATCYGGSGVGNFGGFHADNWSWHGRSHSLNLNLPPLGIVAFKKV
jgi:1,4-alpha-glucan branching enzyme